MEKSKSSIAETFRKLFVKIDVAFHVIAAIMLLVASGAILFFASMNIMHPSRESIIHMINDVLLALIVLELLWTVLRFLKHQKFILGPFFAIGIIAGIRRILLIEAQTSFVEHVEVAKLYEIGLSAIVILILVIAYYISIKAQKLE